MYEVIRDTREKTNKGWFFTKTKDCTGTTVAKLDVGDYTIEGLQHVLCVERKGSVAEFAHNVVEDRFERELKKMDEFEHSFILLEFDLADLLLYPSNCMPKRLQAKCRYNGKYVLKRMIEIMLTHKTQILFCGFHGKDVSSRIFKEIEATYEKE